ncbi:hypothetical protein CGRA01v4_07835 [Colletotrichum graminicola]|nr:hypothetical protein CGRA01v4_07835 [Colletotrichum graminicola]
MQTLRVAMGPLMDPDNPSCLKSQKSTNAWSKYIKGASLIFAWRISQGEVATIITPTPPDCFHPSEMTNLQDIELPVIRGCLGNRPVGRIFLWHPTVKGAESFRYQIWPVDHTSSWYDKFEPMAQSESAWRTISKYRVSTKWAVQTKVDQVIISEISTLLKGTYLKAAGTLLNVFYELTLLVKLPAHCILLLVMVFRLFVHILVRDETDLHKTGNISYQHFLSDYNHGAKAADSGGSREVKQRAGNQDFRDGKVEQLPLRLKAAGAYSTPDPDDCLTQESSAIAGKVNTPIMVPAEFPAPAKHSGFVLTEYKADAKRIRKQLKQPKRAIKKEKKAAKQRSITANESVVGP